MKYKKALLCFLIIAITLTTGINQAISLENKKTPKVVVIGVDGLGWNILNPIISEGRVPFINKMMSNGVYGNFNSINGYSRSQPIWASMITGLTEREHGLSMGGYYRPYFSSNTLNLGRYYQLSDVKGKRIWEYLNNNDITTTMLNLAFTYPVEEINGIMLSGEYAPTFYLSNDKLKTVYPESLRKELIENVGDYEFQKYGLDFIKKVANSKIFNFCVSLIGGEKMNSVFFNFMRINIWQSFLKKRGMNYLATKVIENEMIDQTAEVLKEGDIKKAKTFLYLMQNHPTDFTFIYFTAGGFLEYFFYPFPEDHKDYSEITEKYGYLFGEYVEFIDRFLNEVEKIHGEDTIIILLADHGIAPCNEEWCCNDPDICKSKTQHIKDGVFLIYSSKMDDSSGIKIDRLYDIDLLPLVLQIYDIEVPKNLPSKIKSENKDLLEKVLKDL